MVRAEAEGISMADYEQMAILDFPHALYGSAGAGQFGLFPLFGTGPINQWNYHPGRRGVAKRIILGE